jgi:hypothetical protein
LSDEGMGRPMEAWEERIEGAVPIQVDRTIKWPYEVEVEAESNIPLNARDIVISRMRGMGDAQLSRVITAAGILYWETSESVGMIACLYTACEMERWRYGP